MLAMPELQPFQQRIFEERDDLEDRLKKLKEFFEGDIFPKLSAEERALMSKQAFHMGAYFGILSKRIESFRK